MLILISQTYYNRENNSKVIFPTHSKSNQKINSVKNVIHEIDFCSKEQFSCNFPDQGTDRVFKFPG